MVAVFKYLQAHLCILTDTHAAYLRKPTHAASAGVET